MSDVITEMQEAVEAPEPVAHTEVTPGVGLSGTPEPTEAQCWEQLGRWGLAEKELLAQLQQVRGEYQAWLGKLQAARERV